MIQITLDLIHKHMPDFPFHLVIVKGVLLHLFQGYRQDVHAIPKFHVTDFETGKAPVNDHHLFKVVDIIKDKVPIKLAAIVRV